MSATLLTLVMGMMTAADDKTVRELAPPVRLEAAGKPIDTDIGHAAPFVGDFDGDGVRDLLVGQFGDGILWIYRNVGTNASPKLRRRRQVQGRRQGRPRPHGLMRRLRSPVGGPRRRRPPRPPLRLLAGRALLLPGRPRAHLRRPGQAQGQGRQDRSTSAAAAATTPATCILIAGDAQFEKNDKGTTVIVYEGERIEVPEGKQAGITGTASAVHAADWDGDGELDLHRRRHRRQRLPRAQRGHGEGVRVRQGAGAPGRRQADPDARRRRRPVRGRLGRRRQARPAGRRRRRQRLVLPQHRHGQGPEAGRRRAARAARRDHATAPTPRRSRAAAPGPRSASPTGTATAGSTCSSATSPRRSPTCPSRRPSRRPSTTSSARSCKPCKRAGAS